MGTSVVTSTAEATIAAAGTSGIFAGAGTALATKIGGALKAAAPVVLGAGAFLASLAAVIGSAIGGLEVGISLNKVLFSEDDPVVNNIGELWDYLCGMSWEEAKEGFRLMGKDTKDFYVDGFNGAKNAVLEFGVKIKEEAKDLWNGVKKGWDNLGNKVADFGVQCSTKASSLWSTIKYDWDNVKNKVAQFGAACGTKASNLWSGLKKDWDSLGNKVATFASSCSTSASYLWSSLKSSWDSHTKGKSVTTTAGISSSGNDLWDSLNAAWNRVKNKAVTFNANVKKDNKTSKKWFTSVRDSWNKNNKGKSVELQLNPNTSKPRITTMWNNLRYWWSRYTSGYSLPANATVSGAKGAKAATGGIFSNGHQYPVTRYAGGGLPKSAEVFMAREAGPELVGRIGARTAVVNNDQIVASVSDGVYRAVSAAMGNGNGQAVNLCLQLIMDGKQVTNMVVDRINDQIATTGVVPIKI